MGLRMRVWGAEDERWGLRMRDGVELEERGQQGRVGPSPPPSGTEAGEPSRCFLKGQGQPHPFFLSRRQEAQSRGRSRKSLQRG